MINEKSYIVGVCDATEVDSVKIDFTDPDTKKIVESKKVDLQGKKLFVVPSPDVKSYMVTVHSMIRKVEEQLNKKPRQMSDGSKD